MAHSLSVTKIKCTQTYHVDQGPRRQTSDDEPREAPICQRRQEDSDQQPVATTNPEITRVEIIFNSISGLKSI